MLYTYEILYENKLVQVCQYRAVYLLVFFDGERIVMDCADDYWKVYLASDRGPLRFGETDAIDIVERIMRKKSGLLVHSN